MKIKKVLLADDDADDREIFVRVLDKKTDVQLLNIVENGLEVIDYLDGLPARDLLPHLIILDHNMPKMNGTETLGKLKSDKRYSDIHVVIYSTYSDNIMKQTCEELGASMVLAKPSSMKEYETIIDTFLSLLT
ncbi:MAG TPA: response regulator [Flavitalea sp.]|nr:response regulator [Flavitalea sp.]